MTILTVLITVVTFGILTVPYAWLTSTILASKVLALGCRVHFAIHLFHVFCAYSVRFFGVAFGGQLALCGAIFLLSNLQQLLKTDAGGPNTIRLSFETASPGLAMIVLGVAFVVAGIYKEQEYTSADFYCADAYVPVGERTRDSSDATTGGSPPSGTADTCLELMDECPDGGADAAR